jgi:hypothetical protein
MLTNPVSRLAADVNNSNTINATDAHEVKRRFTGIDTSFAKGDWIFTKSSGDNTVIVNNSNVAEDFYGLCVGDVNGSLLPLKGYSSKANKVSITHSGIIEVSPGQDFFFPLRSITETRVNAISMVIPNSPELLEVLDIQTPVGFPTFTHLNNTIRIAWSELQSLAMHQGDTLLLLKLKATEKFTGDLTINLVATEESELADETGNVIPFAELFAQTIKPLNANVAENQNSILKNCTVFPNPASDLLNLELMANQKAKVNIEIRNMLGKIMRIDEIGEIKPGMSAFRINTADLPDGIYTFNLKLEGDKSKNSYLKKVVICRR